MDATICIGTFGHSNWQRIAATRAIPSANQFGCKVIHEHAETLAQARNNALAKVETEWVCHLDADDELDPNFFKAMEQGTADVRAPSVAYRQGKLYHAPKMPAVWGHRHVCVGDCLAIGNWLVVGSAVRTELALKVGWREWPVYEDFDFWQRCWMEGASFEPIHEAIYIAHIMPNSRNRQPMHYKNAVHDIMTLVNTGKLKFS